MTATVVVAVFALTLFALVRYRRRDDSYPRGRNEAKVAESIYALLLAAVAVVLIAATFRTEARVDPVRADPGLRVDVTAFQWQWRFAYPESGKVVTGSDRRPATLVVPVDTLVRFTATSRDVIHSLWIPSERFKRDAFPGRTTRFDLYFGREGTFEGECAEFCGLRHTDMSFDVRVLGKDAFRTWAASS